MPKVSYISPGLMLKKIKDFLEKSPHKEAADLPADLFEEPEKPLGKTAKPAPKGKKMPEVAKFEDSESLMPEPELPLEKEKTRFNVSLRDLKVISTALMYYHKYLQSKGQTAQAEEVAEVDRKFYEFISAREPKK
ncbi:MAG: hypothetical protein MUE85_20520 [Microscillaceae bacterium]|jgi:hypothetical protein|nr:hypothetical protein [Microscillaceae bacterium]